MTIGSPISYTAGGIGGWHSHGLPHRYLEFYTRTPNTELVEWDEGASWDDNILWGGFSAPAGDADCFAAAPELYTDVNTPLVLTGSQLLAMMGHEWSWQFSTAKGLSIYNILATFETINKARRYHRLDLIYPRLAWGIGYSAGQHSQYGPEPAFASAGVVPDGAGGTLPQNTLPVDATGRGVYCGPGYINLCKWSEGFTDAAWVKNNGGSIATSTSEIGPFGSANGYASLIADNPASGNQAWMMQIASSGWVAGSEVTFSVWIKAVTPYTQKIAVWDSVSTWQRLDVSVTTTWKRHSITVMIGVGATQVQCGFDVLPAGGCYVWGAQLTPTKYVMPYVKTTSAAITVTSCAGTSGNTGLGWTMDAGVLECLRGETDGVEIWNNASASGTNWALATGAWTHTAGSTTPLSIASVLTLTNRYLVTYSVTGRTAGSVTARAGSSGTGGTANTTNASFKEELTCAGSTYIQFVPTTDFNGVVTVTSIQRLLPSRCTVAALVPMGIGSGELTTGGVAHNVVSSGNAVGTCMWIESHAVEANTRKIVTTDGAAWPLLSGGFSRDETHIKIVQTNRLGTQFRVGNRRLGIDSAIQWSSWVTYDGSFNPLTVLRAAYNSTIPIHLKSVQAWDRPVTDAVIYDWAITKLGGGA